MFFGQTRAWFLQWKLKCFKKIQVRHGPRFCNCTLIVEHGEDGNEDVAVVHLSEDDQGLAAGQFAAFYQGRTCLGSGVILESWDDQGFPVCAKALENARMEDKSLLGKPVKIKVKRETLATESYQIDGTELYGGPKNSGISAAKNTIISPEKAVTGFPVNWLHKFWKKWLHIL